MLPRVYKLHYSTGAAAWRCREHQPGRLHPAVDCGRAAEGQEAEHGPASPSRRMGFLPVQASPAWWRTRGLRCGVGAGPAAAGSVWSSTPLLQAQVPVLYIAHSCCSAIAQGAGLPHRAGQRADVQAPVLPHA